MAPVLAKGSVVLGTMVVVLGLATTSLLLLLLLLLCSFFHRVNGQFSTQKMKENSGLVQGVRLVRLGCSDQAAGSPSPGEPQQQVASPAVPGDPDNSAVGGPGLHAPGWTPHSHMLSEPALRTPEFLRHRQLPVVPRDTGTPAADPVPDTEGPIYESIRYKPGTLKKAWDGGSARGDPPSPPDRDKLSTLVQENISQEEEGSEKTPSPVYTQVCKAPRTPQPRQAASPPEPQEERTPSLPEKHFDVA